MKKTILLLSVILTITLTSCTDTDGARKALEHAGYKPIEVGGYAWFGGGENDTYQTKFKAIAPNGKDTVTGVVTSGWFKGNTIRTND